MTLKQKRLEKVLGAHRIRKCKLHSFSKVSGMRMRVIEASGYLSLNLGNEVVTPNDSIMITGDDYTYTRQRIFINPVPGSLGDIVFEVNRCGLTPIIILADYCLPIEKAGFVALYGNIRIFW